MGENIEEHVKCDAGSLAPCSPDIPFKDISNAAARRMAYNALALHVAAHNCDYYTVKYQCKSLENNRISSSNTPSESNVSKHRSKRHWSTVPRDGRAKKEHARSQLNFKAL